MTQSGEVRTRAAVLRDPLGPFEIADVVLDPPSQDELIVRISGVGFCHSDVMARTPVVGPPIVPGHEGSGVIEYVGDAVVGFHRGDHVVLSFDSCRRCGNCLAAQPAYCDEFWPRNLAGYRPGRPTNIRDGSGDPIMGRWFGQSSFAARVVVPARNAIKVNPDLPLELLGPLACGVLTGAGSVFNSLNVEAGSAIAVFGTGTVGLSAIMAARIAGAARIVAVDVKPERLALALELGATHAFDAASVDLVTQIRALVVAGLDYSLDTTGVPSVIATAIDVLRLRGVCGLVGTPRGDLGIRPDQFALGRRLIGILEGDAVPGLLIPKLVDLWQDGRFPFDRLITTFPLARINDAEQAMKTGTAIKPVLIPPPD